MRLTYIAQTRAHASQDRLWGLAFVATLLLPVMLVAARAGIEICTFIIGLSFLWRSWRTRQWAWTRTPFALVCLLAWAWLALVVTPLSPTGHGTAGIAILWVRMPLMFIALRSWVLVTPAARTTLATWLAVLLGLVAIDTLAQFVNGVSLTGHVRPDSLRLTGPFSGPKVGHFLSQLTAPAIALCLAAAATVMNKRAMAASIALLGVVLVTILLSGERSAFMTLLLACGVTVGLVMLVEKRMRLLGAVLAVVTVLAIGTLYEASGWVKMRGDMMVQSMLHYKQSDYGVLVYEGIDMGAQHPWHGVGIQGFRKLCPPLQFEKGGITSIFEPMYPHNFFVELFAETGAPGLLLLLGLIGVLGCEATRHYRSATGAQRLMAAAALGVLVQHFFPLAGMKSFFDNWSAALQWYGLGLVFAALPMPQRIKA